MLTSNFLEIRNISVDYGKSAILRELSLGIGKGEFVALLGSSGCGKTTLLRTIAGFAKPTSGHIKVDGWDVTNLPPDRRGMALMFQSYALWPHMTVAQNIGYGLKLRGVGKIQIAQRVRELQELLGLSGLEDRKPGALSGGQRQRVALGRALAIDPAILLLDEPLSNLDARIRLKVRHDISALQKRLGITAVHVTHDREEAMVMADRIVIMEGGRIAQQGTPETVFNEPASPFVAAFMGAENVLPLHGEVQGGTIILDPSPANDKAVLPLGRKQVAGRHFEVRFRAEAASVLPETSSRDVDNTALMLRGTVEAASYPGGTWRHSIRIGDTVVMADAAQCFAPGERVCIRVPAASAFLFNSTGAAGAAPESHSSESGEKARALEASAA